MKKAFTYTASILAILTILITLISSMKPDSNSIDTKSQETSTSDSIEEDILIVIPAITLDSDKDNDGIPDLQDIIDGARLDAANRPRYRSAYYSGGYPPDNEGVCTDVIWRAFRNAGYNLKEMVDQDIASNTHLYPRVEGHPDPNIDFRRVPNLISFFQRHAQILTTEIIPSDIENLTEWQGGDIVVFGEPCNHIAIVSDRRTGNGVPFIIHNSSPYTLEQNALIYWHTNISPIVHHFRFPDI